MTKKPIPILEFTTGLTLGGTEKMLLSLVTRLSKEKYQVIVACLVYDMEIGKAMREQGIEVICLNARNKLDLRVIWRLYRLLKERKIQLIHSYLFHSSFVARIAGKMARVPIRISGQRDIDLWMKGYHRLWERVSLRWVDKIITLSEAGKRFLLEAIHVSQEKIVVVYNGIEPFPNSHTVDIAAQKKELGIPEGKIVIGSIGRLHEKKGYNYFIEAINILKPKWGNIIYCPLIGKGAEKEKLEKQIHQLGLGEIVSLKGPRLDVFECDATFDIFVAPSLYEGFGIVLLEAMSMKKPIVASRVDGIMEVVKDGHTGILVPPADPKSLAKAIEYLLENKTIAYQMGIQGRQRLEEYFTVDKMVKGVEAVYDKLIKEKLGVEV